MQKVKSDKEAMRIFQYFGHNQWDLVSMYIGHRSFGMSVHDAYVMTLVVYCEIREAIRLKQVSRNILGIQNDNTKSKNTS